MISPSVNSTLSIPSEQLNLPKLEISKFDGRPLKWRTFWDQFRTSVDENENLTKIDKFTYLKSLLTTSAKECIDGLTLTETNYDIAVKLLTERFGNTQILISNHMDVLVKLPNITDINDVLDLEQCTIR